MNNMFSVTGLWGEFDPKGFGVCMIESVGLLKIANDLVFVFQGDGFRETKLGPLR
jgi:hypothetical protein